MSERGLIEILRTPKYAVYQDPEPMKLFTRCGRKGKRICQLAGIGGLIAGFELNTGLMKLRPVACTPQS